MCTSAGNPTLWRWTVSTACCSSRSARLPACRQPVMLTDCVQRRQGCGFRQNECQQRSCIPGAQKPLKRTLGVCRQHLQHQKHIQQQPQRLEARSCPMRCAGCCFLQPAYQSTVQNVRLLVHAVLKIDSCWYRCPVQVLWTLLRCNTGQLLCSLPSHTRPASIQLRQCLGPLRRMLHCCQQPSRRQQTLGSLTARADTRHAEMLPARGATISGPLATSASIAASTCACTQHHILSSAAHPNVGCRVLPALLSGALLLFRPKSEYSCVLQRWHVQFSSQKPHWRTLIWSVTSSGAAMVTCSAAASASTRPCSTGPGCAWKT